MNSLSTIIQPYPETESLFQVSKAEENLILLIRSLADNTVIEINYKASKPTIAHVTYPDFLFKETPGTHELLEEEKELILIGRQLDWGTLVVVTGFNEAGYRIARIMNNTFKTISFTDGG